MEASSSSPRARIKPNVIAAARTAAARGLELAQTAAARMARYVSGSVTTNSTLVILTAPAVGIRAMKARTAQRSAAGASHRSTASERPVNGVGFQLVSLSVPSFSLYPDSIVLLVTNRNQKYTVRANTTQEYQASHGVFVPAGTQGRTLHHGSGQSDRMPSIGQPCGCSDSCPLRRNALRCTTSAKGRPALEAIPEEEARRTLLCRHLFGHPDTPAQRDNRSSWSSPRSSESAQSTPIRGRPI